MQRFKFIQNHIYFSLTKTKTKTKQKQPTPMKLGGQFCGQCTYRCVQQKTELWLQKKLYRGIWPWPPFLLFQNFFVLLKLCRAIWPWPFFFLFQNFSTKIVSCNLMRWLYQKPVSSKGRATSANSTWPSFSSRIRPSTPVVNLTVSGQTSWSHRNRPESDRTVGQLAQFMMFFASNEVCMIQNGNN